MHHHKPAGGVPVRTGGTFCSMADGYAPALFLEVFAFWFILRWLLVARFVLFFGRALVLLMLVGALATSGEDHFVWTACFAGSALLAWVLLRRWRGIPRVRRLALRRPNSFAWHGKSPDEMATLCERRIGLKVEAAAPATVEAQLPVHCMLALAGDSVWVLEDESRVRHPQIGRVVACWDRGGIVAYVERARRGERFELSWPRRGALVRGLMPHGAAADGFAGCLLADELNLRS